MWQARSLPSTAAVQHSAADHYPEEWDAHVADASPVDSLWARSRQARAQLHAFISANGPLARETIFCGSDQPFTSTDFHELHTAPLGMASGIDETLTPSRAQKPRKSNGCGTQIHMAARPAPLSWTADSDGVSAAVIPLEEKYVPAEAAASMIVPTRDACGCSCGFVGCAVCGNPLGMLLTPCNAHMSDNFPQVYSFLPSAVSPSLPSLPPAAQTPSTFPSTTRSVPGASWPHLRSTLDLPGSAHRGPRAPLPLSHRFPVIPSDRPRSPPLLPPLRAPRDSEPTLPHRLPPFPGPTPRSPPPFPGYEPRLRAAPETQPGLPHRMPPVPSGRVPRAPPPLPSHDREPGLRAPPHTQTALYHRMPPAASGRVPRAPPPLPRLPPHDFTSPYEPRLRAPTTPDNQTALAESRAAIASSLATLHDLSVRAAIATRDFEDMNRRLGEDYDLAFEFAAMRRDSGPARLGSLPAGATTRILRVGARSAARTQPDAVLDTEATGGVRFDN